MTTWITKTVPLFGAIAALMIGCGDSSTDTEPGGTDPQASSSTSSASTSTSASTGSTDPSSTSSSTGGGAGGGGTTDPPGTGTAVEEHGSLKVVGNQIQDKNGAPVQLKGMSLFWSQWSGEFYNASLVNTLADDWHATVVRAAMGVEEGGYLQNAQAEKAKVKTIVDAATAKGIYVIIDWHDHNANQHTEQAKTFFTEMAQAYGKQPNVIFEVFNEPDYESWSEVKNYAEQVIEVIRNAGSDNLVIVGSPTWSQDADIAAENPITKFQNIAYTLHFYADSHKQDLRDKATAAMSKGLALFVTEWGTCNASGNGGTNLPESETWVNFLNQNKISWANWSLFNKPESASALAPSAGPNGGWSDADLTESGKFVKKKIMEGN